MYKLAKCQMDQVGRQVFPFSAPGLAANGTQPRRPLLLIAIVAIAWRFEQVSQGVVPTPPSKCSGIFFVRWHPYLPFAVQNCQNLLKCITNIRLFTPPIINFYLLISPFGNIVKSKIQKGRHRCVMGFGERIKSIRGALLQEDFAKKIGVSKTTVGRFEREERVPDLQDLNKILSVYSDIDPVWLITGKPTKPIDEELLEAAIEVTEELLQVMKRQATPKQKTQLILTLYDLTYERKDHVIDRPTAIRLVKLMAA
jgi:transcriptional regulator with XRE-family HTH domain